jgi:hypothetical protein
VVNKGVAVRGEPAEWNLDLDSVGGTVVDVIISRSDTDV